MNDGMRPPESDLLRVRGYCEQRIPEELREQMVLEVDVEGNTVTIVERRPYWRDPSMGWSSLPIAQLRYRAAKWTLHWQDSSEEWHRYTYLEPTEDIEAVLTEIDDDRTAIFWG